MKKISLYFILLIFIFSCNRKDDKTILFNQYLKNTFNMSISQQDEIFIILNLNSCGGCVDKILLDLQPLINDNNHIIILCNNSKYLPDNTFNYRKKKNVLFDIGNHFFNINISPFSDCIIYTKKHKINKLVEVDITNLDINLKYIDSLKNSEIQN